MVFIHNITNEYVVIAVDASVKGKSGIKKIQKNNRTYILCATESILLESMIDYIAQIRPDLLVGFNSLDFDWLLFMERAQEVLGYERLTKVSPIGQIYRRHNPQTATFTWKAGGMSQADYMELIRKYSYGDFSSYSLDNLSHHFLKRPKLPSVYPHHCMDRNGKILDSHKWQKMIQYMIRDGECLVEFEKELGYLELSKMIWLRGLSEPEQIYGTISYIDGAISSEIRRLNMIPPNRVVNDPPTPPKYPGGWVKEPKQGLSHWAVAFDANSLYPMSQVSLNISLETKLFTIINENVVDDVRKCMNGQAILDNYKTDVRLKRSTKQLSVKAIAKEIKDNGLILSPNGAVYSNKEGVIPRVMNLWYSERKEAQKSARKAGDEGNKKMERWYETVQYAIKIMLNSTYGATGSKFSTYYDLDNAKAVTYAGQAVTRHANDTIEKYFRENHGITERCVLYCDTDSAYVDFSYFLNKHLINQDQLKAIDEESEKVKKYLNESYTDFCIQHFNSRKHRFEFKKERVADSIIFLEKKNYVMHVVEDDDKPVDKIKPVGVELIRSSTPVGVKNFLYDITQTILKGDSKKVIQQLQDMRSKFMKLSPYEVAKSSSINNMEKYDESDENCAKWAVGTPVHVKSAICYNFLTRDHRREYNQIKTGTKMKWLYIKPTNNYGWEVFGFIDEDFPEKFGIEVDMEKQFETVVLSYVTRIFKVLGWAVPNLKICSISDYF